MIYIYNLEVFSAQVIWRKQISLIWNKQPTHYNHAIYTVRLLNSVSIRLHLQPAQRLTSKITLTHWGRDKMAVFFQTFSNTFSWMKMYEFWLTFHWSLFLRAINNIQALVQIMAWRRPGDKPLSEPVIVRLSTHICVTRPQWVKALHYWPFVTGITGDGGFPSQRASITESITMLLRPRVYVWPGTHTPQPRGETF